FAVRREQPAELRTHLPIFSRQKNPERHFERERLCLIRRGCDDDSPFAENCGTKVFPGRFRGTGRRPRYRLQLRLVRCTPRDHPAIWFTVAKSCAEPSANKRSPPPHPRASCGKCAWARVSQFHSAPRPAPISFRPALR